MQVKLALILGLVFCSFTLGHNEEFFDADPELINNIIAKHWNRHVESLDARKRDEVLSSPQERNSDYLKSLSHKCDHDEITNPINLGVKQNFDNILAKRGVTKKDISKKQSIPWEPTRYGVNYNFFNNNDPRACYTAGSTVVFGAASSTTACTSDGQTNCVYTCQPEDISSPALQNLFKQNIMPAILEIFDEILTIQRVQGNLKLDKDVWEAFDQQCYDGVPLNESYVNELGPGVPNTDMIVIGAIRPCSNSNTVAYALACNFEWDGSSNAGIFGRPLAGHVNFCPRYFQDFVGASYNQFDFAGVVKVGIHEFTHALGFSSNFYKSYLNSNGQVYAAPSGTFTRSGVNPSGGSFTVGLSQLQTPNIINIANNHFGCNSLTGVELEEHGGAGTAGSHWEVRVAGNEYMTGYVNPVMIISYLTLSLFNDMGFYKSNISKSEYWGWGKDQGCNFVTGRCETSWSSYGYFCNATTAVDGCTADRYAKGNCNVQDYGKALPAYYQHFLNPDLCGDVGADCCSFTTYDTYCADTSQTPQAGLNEVYGSDSLCFPVGKNSATVNNAGCYKFICNSQTLLSVTIGSETLKCPENGGEVQSKTLGGPVSCPSASQVCRRPYSTIDIPFTSGDENSVATVAFSVTMIGLIVIALF